MPVSTLPLDPVRASLTEQQRLILNAIWQWFVEYDTNPWIPSGILYNQLKCQREAVYASLRPLGGRVAHEVRWDRPYRWTLSLLGMLLADRGEQISFVLGEYLRYVRERYLESPYDGIGITEAMKQLGFGAEQESLFKRTFTLSPFHGGGGGDTFWMPLCADELIPVSDFQTYVEDSQLALLDPNAPIDGGKLMLYDRGIREQTTQVVFDRNSFPAEIESAAESNAVVSMLFLDLDNFKPVNDEFDHATGDSVIQDVIALILVAIRGKGLFCHRSGDEMLVLLANFNEEEARCVAERIRRDIEAHSFSTVGQGRITATIGLSTYPSTCPDWKELEVTADRAAMRAKRANEKNRVALWTQES